MIRVPGKAVLNLYRVQVASVGPYTEPGLPQSICSALIVNYDVHQPTNLIITFDSFVAVLQLKAFFALVQVYNIVGCYVFSHDKLPSTMTSK